MSFVSSALLRTTASRALQNLKLTPLRQSTKSLHNICATSHFKSISRVCRSTIGTYNSQTRSYSEKFAETDAAEDTEYTGFTIKDTERVEGTAKKHEFQAETKQLLDIVAKSLYSEKEVFIRELISNSSDALEKLRHARVTGASMIDEHLDLEVHITTDELNKTITIQDFGIGMRHEDLIKNIGTIASSGSKRFVESMQEGEGGTKADNNIGQFGVGFYSAFMVASKIDVFTRYHEPDSQGYLWTSDGSGTYEIAEAEGVSRGTKIVMHLKDEDSKYSLKPTVNDIITRYSNFVGFPIYLDGTRINTVQPLWLQSERDVSEEDHTNFYHFIANASDQPYYSFMYKADAPINLNCVFYFPTVPPHLTGQTAAEDRGLNLYCRKVLIQAKADKVLPDWLRFVRGVVDSEDIPLNLSREMLQNTALLRKIKSIIQTRILKFLQDQNKKDPEKYKEFMNTWGNYLREGIILEESDSEKQEIAKLLLFDSSRLEPGEKKTFAQYVADMPEGQEEIYFICAPSRQLAESSPYIDALKAKDVEVLYSYEPNDDLVLSKLKEFKKKKIMSAENYLGASDKSIEDSSTGSLSESQISDLKTWMQEFLGPMKVTDLRVSTRLESHPCMITVEDMGSARAWLKYMKQTSNNEVLQSVGMFLRPTLEINPKHEIILSLNKLKDSNKDIAELLLHQLYDNAMITAGLMDDPREMVGRLNQLLTEFGKQLTNEVTEEDDTIVVEDDGQK